MNRNTGESGKEQMVVASCYPSGRRKGRNENLRIMTTILLGMVVKDLGRDDLLGLGYREKPVYRAFRSLQRARAIKKVTRRGYAFGDWVMAGVRKFAIEDINHPVGWPSIHNFLFVAYGMFDWDEQKMDEFLSFFKRDWLHRVSRREAEREGTTTKTRERTYSLGEAAEMLGVTVRTMERWAGRGAKIGYVRLPSGRKRLPESEIRRVLLGRSKASDG